MKITDLNPKALWGHFADICAIPHPSHHEEAIRAFVVDFAKKNGLEHFEDSAHNVIVRKPATPGLEGRKGIVLQAHLDMVPQANSDRNFDFTKDSIEPRIEGSGPDAKVKANGTTLGADNGIGVAAMLAILESGELKHGPLEALFTATEETGMEGAFGLKAGELNGEILINLDSERGNELCVGCAGGTDANMQMPYKAEPAPAGYKAVVLEVKGLKGGHSGIEIIMQRANANKLLARTLRPHVAGGVALLAGVDGGGLRNAIPREARAVVLVKPDYLAKFEAAVAEMEAKFVKEFQDIEDGLSVKAVAAPEYPHEIIPAEVAKKLIDLVCIVPDGVVKMSTSMPGLVQTSTNFARIVSDGKVVKMLALMRSSLRSEKESVGERMVALCELVGAKCELTGSYDGWNPNMSSPILKTMSAGYERLFGEKPEITAVHAGLECGIIGGVYPAMDMISCGPTIRFPHSPDEEVNIASVERFWKFLVDALENSPKR
ncbi:MAG: aminoacyl-histidine dipeptidase [Alistipes sp.]|jgi:dipeptidase D|nr:aminoacyl-histidine dipeptidase [Alistipes sp.]